MKRYRAVVATVLTLLLAAGIVAPMAVAGEAEGGPAPLPWGGPDADRGPEMASGSHFPVHLFLRLLGRLDLSDEQVAQIEDIFDAYFPRRQALHDQCAELRLELMKLGLQPQENKEAIAAAVNELRALRQEMAELRRAQIEDIWNVLTEEQQGLIRSWLEGRREGRRGGRHFGGPSRPGGPVGEPPVPPFGDPEMSF